MKLAKVGSTTLRDEMIPSEIGMLSGWWFQIFLICTKPKLSPPKSFEVFFAASVSDFK